MRLILNVYGTPCVKGETQICKDPMGFIEVLKSHPQDDIEFANTESVNHFVECGIADLARPYKKSGWYCSIIDCLSKVYLDKPEVLAAALRTPNYWQMIEDAMFTL